MMLIRQPLGALILGLIVAASGCRAVGLRVQTADGKRSGCDIHVGRVAEPTAGGAAPERPRWERNLATAGPCSQTPALSEESRPVEARLTLASSASVPPASQPAVRLAADSPARLPNAPTPAAAGHDPADCAAQFLDLATLLWMVDGQNPQVALARERIAEAYAQRDQAEYLWLPSLRAGVNYNKHEGAIQDVAGTVFDTSRGSLYGGLGAAAVGAGSPAIPGVWAHFHLADACFQPQIAGHEASARSHAAQAARNTLLRDAAVAYWELVRAEQQQAITKEALQHTEELAWLTEAYARTGQGLKADQQRVAAELAVRRSELLQVEESVRVASAHLVRLLGGDPLVRIATAGQAVVPLELTPEGTSAAELVQQGLSQRPELAESRHLVAQACQRLQREQFAPLIPSVILGLSYGGLGGGLGSEITNTGDRLDADVAAYWELRQLGLGERAVRAEASSRVRQAELRQVADLDRVAQEVVIAHTQVQTRSGRIEIVRAGIQAADESLRLNRDRIQNAQGLPIEVLQSIQSLALLRREYLNAVVDYNIAQFQLWWAAGRFCEPVAAPPQAE
jgi:outer membrane protein TolC